MPSRTADEVRQKHEALAKFDMKVKSQSSGSDETTKIMPLSIKFLANEMQGMGISFFS